jgi:hypothetical protein
MGYELYMKVGRVYEGTRDLTKKEKWFREDCVIDLMKCHESNVGRLAGENLFTKGKPVLYWYENDQAQTEDPYGGKPRPIPTKEVIEALRKDVKVLLDHGDCILPYRRFEWALALLEAIENRDDGKKKEFCVIFNGH